MGQKYEKLMASMQAELDGAQPEEPKPEPGADAEPEAAPPADAEIEKGGAQA